MENVKMHKKEIHQYKLRVSSNLKEVINEIAKYRCRSLTSQVLMLVERIPNNVVKLFEPDEYLLGGDDVKISINFPIEQFKNLKKSARSKKISVNDEVLRRIYWSNPISELNTLKLDSRSRSTTGYTKEPLDRNLRVSEDPTPQTQGLCTQTEDERIMLEKYRSMSSVQRTQIQAISDAIHEPKEIGLNK